MRETTKSVLIHLIIYFTIKIVSMSGRFIKYGVGTDMSKDSFHGCISGMTKDGAVKTIAQRKFKNKVAGHKAFLKWINTHRKQIDLPCQVLMEVTGVYHEALLHYLYQKGLTVCLELARRVKRYLEIIGHKSKNDKLDAKSIAQMACERKLKTWQPFSEQIYLLRSLARHRKALINSKVQFSNQLHAIKISAVKSTEVINSLKHMIGLLKEQIKTVEKELLQVAQSDEKLMAKIEKIVDSVKGIGMVTILTIVSETNGFEAFSSRKQLESYAGYDVVENSSGAFEGKRRISKKGNENLRTCMYMPALTNIRFKTKPFYDFYQRLLKRNGGIKKKALVAVQRKLLSLVFTLWKKDEAFDMKYYTSNSMVEVGSAE